ncbi:beta-ketoacyl synthase chain length factor [Dyadobacter sandarakinus]|uniref:Beta-ketoacyl synthase chain length factor n=1 Tax=Dyadobacter sandarakinus TaxID=2747268 RepID=A0ABX7I4A7_9BACT|nr:beta-ketoacyl synthase chain length factor [Dyadobacter sandarakinus]QRR00931.1 beta-ketoacyl synthase chain length factor [Dyadobacter sandarakinus]
MVYLSAASTISHQPAFGNPGFSDALVPLQAGSALVAPDYRQYVEAGLLRRMSKILRMSVACAKDCLQQAGTEQPGAIVVGTGLGCLHDTEKFLNNATTIQGLLPPTAFIQSTHNTIAGQISLSIGNHEYNMTHTQNSLSFENALLDAMLLAEEGTTDILVGAADESIELLADVAANLGFMDQALLTSGASFFVVTNQKPANPLAEIVDVFSEAGVRDWKAATSQFLAQHAWEPDQTGMVLLLAAGIEELNEMKKHFADMGISPAQCVNLIDYSGVYPTAAAFGLHMAADLIHSGPASGNILICNNLNKHNLGLIALRSIEA